MTRLANLSFFFLLMVQTFLAQDLIVKRDSSRINANIREIRKEAVFFTQEKAIAEFTLSTAQIAYIRLKNGYTQKFEVLEKKASSPVENKRLRYYSVKDSLHYFSHPKSIAVNYLCFLNRELGLIFQREDFKKQISVVIPLTFGLDRPGITHRFYFRENFGYTVSRKILDSGIGVHYFPNYRRKTNFYIGPMFRAQFFKGEQVLLPATNSPLIIKESFLSRYSLSLTTGYLFRTQSRIQVSVFTSLGACADFVPMKIKRPLDNTPVDPIGDRQSFYFWTGFLVGYCF